MSKTLTKDEMATVQCSLEAVARSLKARLDRGDLDDDTAYKEELRRVLVLSKAFLKAKEVTLK